MIALFDVIILTIRMIILTIRMIILTIRMIILMVYYKPASTCGVLSAHGVLSK